MVPSSFTAIATGAGVLLGLLFVAVSVRTDTIFGDAAPPMGRAQADAASSAWPTASSSRWWR